MRLAAKYDIEAPVDHVYGELTDFDAWERMAIRRGAEVTRTDRLAKIGPGMEWQVGFAYRNKPRTLRIRLAEAAPTSKLAVALFSGLADGEIRIDLLDLAATRTRIEVVLEVKPKTLAARIYVQTLRLARKKVDTTFAQRVAQLAVEIEDRYRRQTGAQSANPSGRQSGGLR